MLKDPQVLILDEPASAPDFQSCEHLKKISKGLGKDTTIISADHQLAFSHIVDVNYILHEGNVDIEHQQAL